MTDVTASARLRREWVLYAGAAAASRFLPVPLLDDLVKEQATRAAVTRTWRAHGRRPSREVVDILTGESSRLSARIRRALGRLPLLVLLYPWRKALRIARAAHGVSDDAAQVLLLARSVDRCLSAGWFAVDDPQLLRRQAEQVRLAHEQAVAGSDLRVLRHALGVALRRMRGMGPDAARIARRAVALRRPAAGPAPLAGPEPAGGAAAVLDSPEVSGVLATLDARFDAALARGGGGGRRGLGGRTAGRNVPRPGIT